VNLPELDPLIHQATRLRVLALLSGVDEADFNFLSGTLALTDGNLSVHTSKLEQAGYLEIRKSFEGKLPRTTYRLTPRGREGLERYWQALEEIRRMGEG
jgi:DNA-binding MarR family transcriptional regulator